MAQNYLAVLDKSLNLLIRICRISTHTYLPPKWKRDEIMFLFILYFRNETQIAKQLLKEPYLGYLIVMIQCIIILSLFFQYSSYYIRIGQIDLFIFSLFPFTRKQIHAKLVSALFTNYCHKNESSQIFNSQDDSWKKTA